MHVVDAFAALGVEFLQLGLLVDFLLFGQARVRIDFHDAFAEIGYDEEFLFTRRQELPALLVDLGVAGLFIDREEKIVVQLRHALFPDIIPLHLLDELLDAGFLLQLQEFLVLRHATLRLQQPDSGAVVVLLVIQQRFRLRDDLRREAGLGAYELLHVRQRFGVFARCSIRSPGPR